MVESRQFEDNFEDAFGHRPSFYGAAEGTDELGSTGTIGCDSSGNDTEFNETVQQYMSAPEGDF
ncbi:MAG: hypothetical protein ABI221_00580 [Candidatus Saccharimonadales bacterium]